MTQVEDSTPGESPDPTGSDRPHLWNPNVAANWSILFTPAFGAYIHALNWKALGMPERARADVVWIWLTGLFLVVDIGSVAADSETVDRVMQKAPLVFLAAWYFIRGRSQSAYVRDELGNDYVRKDWKKPLLIGLAIAVGVIALLFLAVFAVGLILRASR